MSDILTESAVKRSFFVLGETYYGKHANVSRDEVETIYFGRYLEDGGCSAEASITWRLLGNKTAMKVGVYDDALSLLTEPVLLDLAKFENRNPTVRDMIAHFASHGWQDTTERVHPAGMTPICPCCKAPLPALSDEVAL